MKKARILALGLITQPKRTLVISQLNRFQPHTTRPWSNHFPCLRFLSPLCCFIPMMYQFILYWHGICAKGSVFWVLWEGEPINRSTIATDVRCHSVSPWPPLTPLPDGVGWKRRGDQQLGEGGISGPGGHIIDRSSLLENLHQGCVWMPASL